MLLPGRCPTRNLAGCAAVSSLAIPRRDGGSVEGDLGCTLSIARHRLLLVGLASCRPRRAVAEQLGEFHPGPVHRHAYRRHGVQHHRRIDVGDSRWKPRLCPPGAQFQGLRIRSEAQGAPYRGPANLLGSRGSGVHDLVFMRAVDDQDPGEPALCPGQRVID